MRTRRGTWRFESVVASSRLGLAADRLPGLSGHGCEPGVGSEFVAGREPVGVADLREDACSGAWPDPGHRQEHVSERVGSEHLLDLLSELGSAVVEPFEFDSELRDDLAKNSLGRQHDGLRVERREDIAGKVVADSWHRCGEELRHTGTACLPERRWGWPFSREVCVDRPDGVGVREPFPVLG